MTKIISFGSSCCPALSLRTLCLKKETYPFDWVRTNSKIIYEVLRDENGSKNYYNFMGDKSDNYFVKDLFNYDYPKFPKTHINYYGQYFTHYTNISCKELSIKMERYIKRLFDVLERGNKILFIHSNEEFIYHKLSRDNKKELYLYLCKINDLLEERYKKLNFTIINIDIDNRFENYKNIINLNMEYDKGYSDFCENHKPKFYEVYRENITKIVKDYLQNSSIIK